MSFPIQRGRRLRRTEALRSMVREVRPAASQLVYPVFVDETADEAVEIPSMAGQFRHTIPSLVDRVGEARDAGVRSVILFGIPRQKDARGSSAWEAEGIIPRALRALRNAYPDVVLMTDVCMCEYTDHGHCGVLEDGEVDNDETLELLAREAVAHASAGADVVAPSDMMDGRVDKIRRALDDAGLDQTAILSYAVKYASAFYGPFRDAADSTPQEGDRKGYQMDPARRREAVQEARWDVAEGADMVMVKPALAYLDILRDVRDAVAVPVAAYQVSGELAMLQAAGDAGYIDFRAAALEALTSTIRAGADLVLTYLAPEYAAWLADRP